MWSTNYFGVNRDCRAQAAIPRTPGAHYFLKVARALFKSSARGVLPDRHDIACRQSGEYVGDLIHCRHTISSIESEGLASLEDFLKERSRGYVNGLSSPAEAWESCSRISPYLTYGNLSMRTVYQRVSARRRDLQRLRGARDPWSKALSAYEERLAWHCHFMQKLEDEPAIEFENMNRAFDGLREDQFNADYFEAWATGHTGYPMVDACMRALIATGWINFRMRAMLVSFSAHHLWLHWRKPALHLARCFVDYEPGIHYSQIQMQSGTTGISALRIYSPIKQAKDQDPHGHFIRRWVPELANVSARHIAEPHRMSSEEQEAAGCRIGRDYPAPIVDHLQAYGAAKKRMYAARKQAKISGESDRVFHRHGSRRRQSARMRGRGMR